MEPCTVRSLVVVVITSIYSYYLFVCFLIIIVIIIASFVFLALYFMASIDRPPFHHLPVIRESQSL